MSERAIVLLGLMAFAAVGLICGVIFDAVEKNHQQVMSCLQAGGSSTEWGCLAKGGCFSFEKQPLFGSAK